MAGAVLGQAVGVAWGVGLFYAITQPVYVCTVFRKVGVGTRQVLSLYLRPTGCALVAVGTRLGVSMVPVLAAAPLAQVVVIGTIGSGLYAALVRWSAPEVWGELGRRLGGAMRRDRSG